MGVSSKKMYPVVIISGLLILPLFIGNAYFLFVNQNIRLDGCGDWLKKSLNRKRKIIRGLLFLCIFNPSQAHDPTKISVNYIPICLIYIMSQWFFTSHNHFYERVEVQKKNQVTYIVTGGGGATLYDPLPGKWTPRDTNGFTAYTANLAKAYHFCNVQVSPDRVTLSVIDVNGNQIDKTVF